MPTLPGASTQRRIRLVILDDAPFVRRGPDVHPLASTFHRFAAAVVAAGPFAPARYLAPVRELGAGEPAPVLPPVDRERLEVVPTAPFRGAAGYLAAPRSYAARNRPVVRAVRGADLAWIRVPASNAMLVERAARRHGVPRFIYVAGRTGDVGGQTPRGAAAGGPRLPRPLRRRRPAGPRQPVDRARARPVHERRGPPRWARTAAAGSAPGDAAARSASPGPAGSHPRRGSGT